VSHTVDAPAGAEAKPVRARRERAPRRPARTLRPLRAWRELAFGAGFYAFYSLVRNTQGSAAVSSEHALHNALRVISLERTLGIYHEQTIQQAFLGNRLFIEFWNHFYGSFHFVVTAFALVLLFRKFPHRYRRFRNALACTTALALIGFAFFPLMPPRLLPGSYHFVDTLERYGALWSFDSGTVERLSNQYAAMPSLHFAWSAWSAFALFPVLRTWWAKSLAAIYPLLTLFGIVVTANHYFLDAAGGAVVLAVGLFIGFGVAARIERGRRDDEPAPAA
jgi:hypothetical protein